MNRTANRTALSKARTENTILKDKLDDARAQIENLEGSIKSMKNNSEWQDREKRRLQDEVDNMHAFLDAVPGCIGRTAPARSEYGSPTQNTAMTRLAAWLATKDHAPRPRFCTDSGLPF